MPIYTHSEYINKYSEYLKLKKTSYSSFYKMHKLTQLLKLRLNPYQ